MFKKIFSSTYVKAAITLSASGAVLIIFNNWISKSKISLGLETLNDTLMPVYIGMIFAFLLCPIYNRIVAGTYRYLKTNNNADRRASIGPTAFLAVRSSDGNEARENSNYLKIARVVATTLCFLLLSGMFILLGYFILPKTVESAIELVNTFPQKLVAFTDWMTRTFTRFPDVTVKINNIANAGATEILMLIRKFLFNEDGVPIESLISDSIMTFLGAFVDFLIGVLIMIYLLNVKDRLCAIGRKLTAALFSERRSAGVYEFAEIINETFLGFITGKIIDSIIIGILTYFVLVVCNISFAPVIAVLIGVTNVIPFFGPFIGAIPATLILLIESPIQAVYFVVIIFVIQQIDGNIIGPKIIGSAIGISSFWVLISVLIGGGLFGFIGMVLGVPVFAVIYRYIDKLAINSLERKNKNPDTDDYFTLEQYDIDASEIALKNAPKTKRRKKKNADDKARAGRNVFVSEGAEDSVDEGLLIDTSIEDNFEEGN